MNQTVTLSLSSISGEVLAKGTPRNQEARDLTRSGKQSTKTVCYDLSLVLLVVVVIATVPSRLAACPGELAATTTSFTASTSTEPIDEGKKEEQANRVFRNTADRMGCSLSYWYCRVQSFAL